MYEVDITGALIMASVVVIVIMVHFIRKGRSDLYHWVLAFLIVLVLFLALFYARIPGEEKGSTFFSLIGELGWPPRFPWSD